MPRSKGRGRHRKRREPAPWPGMMLHQDGSDHEWVPRLRWDLIVTMDDATNEHYSMFSARRRAPGAASRGCGRRSGSTGCSARCTRTGARTTGTRRWRRQGGPGQPDAVRAGDGPARHRDDSGVLAGGAGPLGAGVPDAPGSAAEGAGGGGDRGHGVGQPLSAGGVHAGVQRGVRASREGGGIGVRALRRPCGAGRHPVRGPRAHGGPGQLRAVERMALQLPADRHRPHYVKARVKVRRHADGALSVWARPRRLARYGSGGERLADELPVAA